MADPITLIVLVAVGDAASPQTRAMAKATRDALGGASVEILEARDPSVDEALALERAAHASATVEVTWSGVAHRRATLRVHLARTARWVERSFGFGANDAASEQGRTLGFAVASIFPDTAAGNAQPANDPSSPSNEGPSASAPGSLPAPGVSVGGSATAPNAGPPEAAHVPSAADSPTPSASSPFPSVRVEASGTEPPRAAFAPQSSPEGPLAARFLLDLLAIDVSGDAGGFGGSGALAWFPLPAVALRLGGGARASTLDVAQSSGVTLFASAGAVLRPWRATHAQPFELSLRVDYVLSHLSLTHFDNDEPSPITRARWLSGTAAIVDAGWLFAATVEVVAGVGFQNDFGATAVEDKGAQVATVPSFRVVGEGGVRVGF